MYKKLILMTTLLTLVLIMLGAFVRLSDAGLGCPDWPGCYGNVVAPHSDQTLQSAANAFPQTPIDTGKAWIEMAHRYVAGVLGVLILSIALISWREKRKLKQSPTLATTLLALVVFQALLGMWTVTLLLKPAIVTLHLLGGMATLALLTWLAMRQIGFRREHCIAGYCWLKLWGWIGLAILILQIVLGGWVSTNYAALACPDFPTCRFAWVPPMEFQHAFHVTRELGMTASGDFLSRDSLTAIHWSHRVGALITFVVLAAISLFVFRISQLRRLAAAVLLLVATQVILGISNVLASLPLALAVAHNGVAALLLMALVMLNFRINLRIK
jgi:heme a synthase